MIAGKCGKAAIGRIAVCRTGYIQREYLPVFLV
jgi:hypothetical protein